MSEQNKALALETFDTLFNRRDYAAAARFWSPDYIQHSAHIAPGREGLFDLIRTTPDTLRYEHGLILAEGDHVMVHGSQKNEYSPTRAQPGVPDEIERAFVNYDCDAPCCNARPPDPDRCAILESFRQRQRRPHTGHLGSAKGLLLRTNPP